MENYLIENPLIVNIYDPIGEKILNKIVFVGDVPIKIKKAIKLEDKKILREFYGNDWRYKLGIENTNDTQSIIGGNQNENQNENHNKKNYYGGIEYYEDEEFYLDDEDLEELESEIEKYEKLEEEEIELLLNYDGETIYIYDIGVYPEDNMMDIRKKIYAGVGLPIYRQHLFYIIKGIVMVPYILEIF